MFLDEYQDISSKLEKACIDFEKDPSLANCDTIFRLVHTIKGSSQTVGLKDLGDFVHHLEDALVKIKSGKLPVTTDFVGALFSCLALTDDWIALVRNNSPIELKSQIEACLGQLTNAMTGAPAAIREAAPSAVSNVPKKPESKETKKDIDESVRVSTKKIDRLLQLVGEISSQVSIIGHNAKRDPEAAGKALYFANKIARELREQTLSLRMQPIEPLFQKMERTARDVARTLGKQIQVTLSGSEVELDKMVVESIRDPLLHIIRNAVDHGLEKPDDRTKAGKNPLGQLTINAINHANGVNITIMDDGRGLDSERILNKALEKGLIAPGSTPSEEQIHQMIMLPGFSTAAEVTEISGRGVGMDVVKSAIDECSGDIQIASKFGHGSSFTVFIPATVSIMDALIIDVDGLLYAIPIQEIAEIVDLVDYKIARCTGEGQVLTLRKEIVPLKRLSDFLPSSKFERKPQEPTDADTGGYYRPGLIIRRRRRICAFEVTRVIGIQSIVIRPLEGEFKRMKCFSGCTILQDGEPGYILNIGQMAQSYLEQFESAAPAA